MTIRVLYVDDYPELADTVAEFLEAEVDDFSVEIATSAADGLDVLAENTIDCVISDYEMPETDGLDFLRIVREDHPDLPFILFTGKGSEEIASEAIAAGVTDYVQKGTGTSQYSVLANRAQNAVGSYLSRRQLQKLRRRYERVSMASADAFFDWDVGSDHFWWSEGLQRTFGYTYAEIENDHHWWDERVHPEDRQQVKGALCAMLENEKEFMEGEHRFKRADETYATVVSRAYAVYDDEENPVRIAGALIDVTERKAYERKLDALHEVTRDLLYAESEDEVSRMVVEAVSDVLDLSLVAIYLFDADENVLEPVAASDDVGDVVGEPPTFEAGSSIAWQVFVEGEPAVHDDVRESEHVYNPDTPVRSELIIPLSDHGVFVSGSVDTKRFDEETIELVDFLAATTETALNHVVQTAALEERDRQLQSQKADLDRLVELNEQIRSTEQAVVRATTREEIEDAVCDSLVEVDRFEFAWIGTFGRETETTTPRAWAGGDYSYLDTVVIHGDSHKSSDEPTVRAAARGDPVVVSNTSDALRDEPWRKVALEKGYHSVLSVPIRHDEITYGVLSVYANRPDAFDDLSQSVFAELGDTVAYAVNAVETKQSLLTDRLVELELRVPTSDGCLQRLARQATCEVEFKGGVVQTAETTRLFVEVTGSTGEDVRSFAEKSAMIETAQVISDEDGETLTEIVISGSCLPLLISDQGGRLRSLVARPDETLANVELPHSADVRRFVEQIQTRFPEAELVARRDRRRPIQTRQTFRDQFLDRLTRRQWEVLQTAYLSGYFSWPRKSSGKQVAESLGIAPPTFHNHLRQAEQELFSLLISDRDVATVADEG